MLSEPWMIQRWIHMCQQTHNTPFQLLTDEWWSYWLNRQKTFNLNRWKNNIDGCEISIKCASWFSHADPSRRQIRILLGPEKDKLGLTYCLPQSSISRARAPKSILNWDPFPPFYFVLFVPHHTNCRTMNSKWRHW